MRMKIEEEEEGKEGTRVPLSPIEHLPEVVVQQIIAASPASFGHIWPSGANRILLLLSPLKITALRVRKKSSSRY